MKKIITILFLVTAIIAKSQIQVGSADFPQGNRSGKLSPENIGKLKSLFTTIFILQTGDSLRKAEFENAISQVWTVNKFKVILPHEQIQYANRTDCAFGHFDAFLDYSNNTLSRIIMNYKLEFPIFSKNGKIKEWNMISSLNLFPDNEYRDRLLYEKKTGKVNIFLGSGTISSEELSKLMYSSVYFKNWSPGFLKGYFKKMNDVLESGNTFRSYYDDNKLNFLNHKNLIQLKGDTLYLPEYIKDDCKDFELKNLPFTVSFISQIKLDSMILNRIEKFYYLSCIINSSEKYINVFEGASGNMIYTKYSTMEYKFKKYDLKKIAEAIDK